MAVRLFSNRSQMTSKCGKNKKVAHEAQPSVSLMFLPHYYNGRLPSTLTNCIAKNRNLSNSIRARDSLLVPGFNTRFMKNFVAYRGAVLWNMLTSRYTDLADKSLCKLVKKLKTSDLFQAAKFNVLSASTVSFEHEDFVYN